MAIVFPPAPAAAEVIVIAVLAALAGMHGLKLRVKEDGPVVTVVIVYK